MRQSSDCVLLRIQIFLLVLKFQNPPWKECYAFSKSFILYQLAGLARSRRPPPTSPQRRKLCHFKTGPRLEGILALGLWDLPIEVWHSGARRKPFRDIREGSLKRKKKRNLKPPNAQQFRHTALSCILEVCEAVIKMIITCRISSMKHVSRTHRELLLIG